MQPDVRGLHSSRKRLTIAMRATTDFSFRKIGANTSATT